MNEYLNDQTNLFRKDSKKLAERRSQWPNFEKRAIKQINEWIEDAQKSGYYEYLYLITDKDIPNRTSQNQSFLQFYAGSRPTGITATIKDKLTINLQGVSEDSGCLSIIQEPRGGVFFLAFPAKSDVLKWEDDYILINFFKSPDEVEWYDIRKAIEFYLRFARYTSIYSEPTIWESFELWKMKLKAKVILNVLYKGAHLSLRLISALKLGMPVS